MLFAVLKTCVNAGIQDLNIDDKLCLSFRIGKFRRVLALEEADQEGFEEEGYYYHQRKRGDPKSRAQQQLRELEGKERLERSRVERRLKLTQSIRQGMLHGNHQPLLHPLLTQLEDNDRNPY